MSKQVQIRRGTGSEHSNFTGAVGEVTYNTTDKTLVVHDGSTKGGFPLAKEKDHIDLREDFDEHKLDYMEHLNSNIPHKMKIDGKDYKYGLSQENGFLKFVYEEVI